MTNEDAIKILTACKSLAERASAEFPAGLPLNFKLTSEDLVVLEDFEKVQSDPVAAGPGLLKRLFAEAKLTPVEVYKLEQLRRLVFKRRYLGRDAANGYKVTHQ